MSRLRLAPEARQDIKAIGSHIALDSVEAAARVRQEIRDACRHRPNTTPLEILRVLHGKRDVKSVLG